LSVGAIEELKGHSWKGNVRELENCIQRGLVLSGGEEILAGHLGLDDHEGPWAVAGLDNLSYEEGKQEALKRFKRRFVERALQQAQGNVTHAASSCGLTRAAFQRIMRTLDVSRSRFTA
jgi:DNA-binding NtrC family response regulator